jgi:hypothetical protein
MDMSCLDDIDPLGRMTVEMENVTKEPDESRGLANAIYTTCALEAGLLKVGTIGTRVRENSVLSPSTSTKD